MTGRSGLLTEAVAALGQAGSLEQVQHILRSAARLLVDAHGATVVLLEQGRCFYADEDAISPLWKGQRFPIEQCISGWAMLHGQPAVVPDIGADERIPQAAYRPTFVRGLVAVPIGIGEPVGAIGAYWARRHRATDRQVTLLTALAGAAEPGLRRYLRSQPAGEPRTAATR